MLYKCIVFSGLCGEADWSRQAPGGKVKAGIGRGVSPGMNRVSTVFSGMNRGRGGPHREIGSSGDRNYYFRKYGFRATRILEQHRRVGISNVRAELKICPCLPL